MTSRGWASVLGDLVRAALRSQPPPVLRRTTGRPASARRPAYRGDFTGVARVAYDPHPDGLPDPGEVVWAWVPYEEDASRGKDRPVLVVARVPSDPGGSEDLLALPLTSRDHDGGPDEAQEARAGRKWLDLGSGPWDRRGRPSEVRLDRVLRLDPAAVRREGAVLDRARFDRVAARLRERPGWT